jgi:phenylalanyl-tRNA synthetase beta chain
LSWWEFNFGIFLKFAGRSRQFRALPKYPGIERDIAILVGSEIKWAEIERIIVNMSPLLPQVKLFDVFTSAKLGRNKKSFAFKLTFKSEERTLKSAEVDQAVTAVINKLKEAFKAVVR